MKTIQSPDGVTLLMENLWLRHKAGMKQHLTDGADEFMGRILRMSSKR